jgi:malto-oligosyltrehalose trehalohydrolase
MKFGTKIMPHSSIKFNLWAPDAQNVKLCLKQENNFAEIPMKPTKNGWFTLKTKKAKINQEYMFKIDGKIMIPDPASRFQAEDVHGPSIIINPELFDWENDFNWKNRPWEESIIYELHVGSFTFEGTFNAAAEKLDYLASLGITAVELMPVADFPGTRNWGYDGVLIFAPDNTYGTPDDLKNFIKKAHEKNLMVFLDVVYNHFGPEGNYLHIIAKSKLYKNNYSTPWGDGINFEDRIIRDFFVQNALFWIEEYHFDGLRIDAVHSIEDFSKKHIIEEISESIKKKITSKQVHLILENDDNSAGFLKPGKNCKAQWNDDFHHCAHVILTGETQGYYEDYEEKPAYYLAKCLAEGFVYQGEPSSFRGNRPRGENSKELNLSCFVNFLQNHDQTGNRTFGERIFSLCSKEALKALVCLHLGAPGIPLIFMGEEWGSIQPFMFFCDFSEELSDSVRQGRKKEFEKFLQFKSSDIPDPCSERVFKASCLDWQNLNTQENLDFFIFYKQMLQLRHKYILPLISEITPSKRSFKMLNNSAFQVEWPTYEGKNLQLIANLSNYCLYYPDLSAENIIFHYSPTRLKDGELPPWSVLWILK